MLNIEGVNFNDLYTLKDIEEYALVADPSLFEFVVEAGEPDDWPYRAKPNVKVEPFNSAELVDLVSQDNYTCIITQAHLVNNKLKRLWYHLQDINPVSNFEDIHLYICKGDNQIMFGAHHDRPNNLIIQGEGTTEWTLYKEYGTLDETNARKNQKITKEVKKTLKSGEHLFIPARKYHLPESKKGRLSVSVLYW
jgi:ribosomal protein L16 Arg81 hydroxylase